MKKLIVLIAIALTLMGLMAFNAPNTISAEKVVDAQMTDVYILIGKRLRTRIA